MRGADVSVVATGGDLSAEIASLLREDPGAPARTIAKRLGTRKP